MPRGRTDAVSQSHSSRRDRRNAQPYGGAAGAGRGGVLRDLCRSRQTSRPGQTSRPFCHDCAGRRFCLRRLFPIAKRVAAQGYHAFVVKYRAGKDNRGNNGGEMIGCCVSSIAATIRFADNFDDELIFLNPIC